MGWKAKFTAAQLEHRRNVARIWARRKRAKSRGVILDALDEVKPMRRGRPPKVRAPRAPIEETPDTGLLGDLRGLLGALKS